MSNLPLTYTDWLMVNGDLDPLARETTSDLQSLTQDVANLLLELPGTNPDDPQRGVGVEQYLSGTTVDVAGLPAIIEGQLLQDSRISGATADITKQPNGDYLLTVTIQASETILPLSFIWNLKTGLSLL